MDDAAEAQGWPGIVRTLRDLGCSPGEIGAATLALGGGATAREALHAMREASGVRDSVHAALLEQAEIAAERRSIRWAQARRMQSRFRDEEPARA